MNLTLPQDFRVEREREDKLHLSFVLKPELLYFQGHFPESPILPGVVQLGWAIHWAQEFFKIASPVQKIEALKFQMVLQPGDEARLELEHRSEKQDVLFAFHSLKGRHASGRLVFRS